MLNMDDAQVEPVHRKQSGKPLGLGVVGGGAFGEFCIQAYAGIKEIILIAVADIDIQRASAIAPRGAHVYGDYRDLLQAPDVDIVAIITPPYLHGKMIQQAAEAKKHIFVEKPLATSLDEAYKVAETVREAGVKLSIDYVLRYHPLHCLAAKVINTHALGQFQHFSLENFATDENLPPAHWFWKRSKSGGIHVEHGVHFFDLCNHFAGRAPSKVSGYSQKREDGRQDRVGATVIYGDEIIATFYHSFNRIRYNEQTSIRLHFSRGSMILSGWIPTNLRLQGLVDKDGQNTLQALFLNNLQIHEHFHGQPAAFQQNGVTEHIVAEVSAEIKAPDRQRDYQQAIQAGMKNLIGAIRGEEPLKVDFSDGLLSLAMALAASDERTDSKFIPPQVKFDQQADSEFQLI